jgi:hypothetical protein
MTTYTIIGFNKQIGQLTIRFHPDMNPLAVDVPIENGQYITGEALDTYIKNFIPTWHIERLAAIQSGVSNENVLESLVIPEPISEVANPPSAQG